MIYKENNKEKTFIKKFLKEYYTVEEVVSDKVITEDMLNNEMDKYTNYLDEKCLEQFASTRGILAVKVKSQKDQFVSTIDKINIEYKGKTKDNEKLEKYSYKVDLKLIYEDGSSLKTSVDGEIRIKNTDNQPIITYFDYTALK